MANEKDIAYLPDEYLIAIGRMSVNYSFLEDVLQISIWGLLGVEEEQWKIITYRQPINHMYKTLLALVKHQFDGEQRRIFLNALHSANSAVTKRNRIAHGQINLSTDAPKALLNRSHKEDKEARFLYGRTPEDLHSIAKELDMATKNIAHALVLCGLLEPSDDTPSST